MLFRLPWVGILRSPESPATICLRVGSLNTMARFLAIYVSSYDIHVSSLASQVVFQELRPNSMSSDPAVSEWEETIPNPPFTSTCHTPPAFVSRGNSPEAASPRHHYKALFATLDCVILRFLFLRRASSEPRNIICAFSLPAAGGCIVLSGHVRRRV